MVGRTYVLLSIVKRQAGDVDGQRRTQKGPPGTVFVKYFRNMHWTAGAFAKIPWA